MKKIFTFVLAAVMIFALASCSTEISTEKAVDNYFDLFAKPSKGLIDDCFPAAVLEHMEARYDMDADDILAKCEKASADLNTELEFRYGANCKTTYEVLNVSTPEKDDYDDIMEDLQEIGLKSADIEDIAEAEVKITCKGDESENTYTETFDLFKVGGNWYAYDIVEIIPVLD